MTRFANSNRHAAGQISQIRYRRQPYQPVFLYSSLDPLVLGAPRDDRNQD